jgi:hypothetical protein
MKYALTYFIRAGGSLKNHFFTIYLFILLTISLIIVPNYNNQESNTHPVIMSNADYIQASAKESSVLLGPVVQIHLLIIKNGNLHPAGTATAFSVSASKSELESYLLANAHFCSDAMLTDDPSSALVTYTKATEKASMGINPTGLAKIIYSDPDSDMCLLLIDEYIKPVKFEERRVTPVTPVKIVGAPDGIFPIIFDTYVSGMMLRTEILINNMAANGSDYIFLSGMIVPGSSGSPVFNKSNKVIGMVFATPQSMYGGIAIQSIDIIRWLDKQGVKYNN